MIPTIAGGAFLICVSSPKFSTDLCCRITKRHAGTGIRAVADGFFGTPNEVFMYIPSTCQSFVERYRQTDG
jgi:hypothetical protein